MRVLSQGGNAKHTLASASTTKENSSRAAQTSFGGQENDFPLPVKQKSRSPLTSRDASQSGMMGANLAKLKGEPTVINIDDDDDEEAECDVPDAGLETPKSEALSQQNHRSPARTGTPDTTRATMTPDAARSSPSHSDSNTQASCPLDVVDSVYTKAAEELSLYNAFVYAHFVILTGKEKETNAKFYMYAKKITNISRLSFPEGSNGSMYMTRKVHCTVGRNTATGEYTLVNYHKACGVVVDGVPIKAVGGTAKLRHGSRVNFGGREGIPTVFKIGRHTPSVPALSPSPSSATASPGQRRGIASYFSNSPARTPAVSSVPPTQPATTTANSPIMVLDDSPPTIHATNTPSYTPVNTTLLPASDRRAAESRPSPAQATRPAAAGGKHAPAGQGLLDNHGDMRHQSTAGPVPAQGDPTPMGGDRVAASRAKDASGPSCARQRQSVRDRTIVELYKAEPAADDNRRKRTMLSPKARLSKRKSQSNQLTSTNRDTADVEMSPVSAHSASGSTDVVITPPSKRLQLEVPVSGAGGAVVLDRASKSLSITPTGLASRTSGVYDPTRHPSAVAAVGVAGVVTDNRSHCASALTCKPRAIRVLSAQVDALIDDALDDASEVSDAGLSAILPFMTPTAVPSGAALLKLVNKLRLQPISLADAAHTAFISRTMVTWATATRQPLVDMLPGFIPGVLGHAEADWKTFHAVLAHAFTNTSVHAGDADPGLANNGRFLAVSVLADICTMLDAVWEWQSEARVERNNTTLAGSPPTGGAAASLASPLRKLFDANRDGSIRSMRIVIDTTLPSFGRKDDDDFRATRDKIATTLLRHMYDEFPSHRLELLTWVSGIFGDLSAGQSRSRFLDALQGDELRADLILHVSQRTCGLSHAIKQGDYEGLFVHGMDKLGQLQTQQMRDDQAQDLEKVLLEAAKMAYKRVCSGYLAPFLTTIQLDCYCATLEMRDTRWGKGTLRACRREQLRFFLLALAV